MKKTDDRQAAGFFRTNYRKLVRYLTYRYEEMDEMDAEDIVSDVMAELFGDNPIADEIGNLTGYVYAAVRNRSIDLFRKRKASVSLDESGGPEGGTIADTIAGESPSHHEEEIRSGEMRTRIVEALDALVPDQRAVWVATEIDGLGFAELAARWRTPIGTLLARKHRATAALQLRLNDYMQP